MRHEALPQGSLRMPGEGFNGNSSTVEVAITTANINKPEELDKRFFGEDNPNTLARFQLASGGEVRIHHATGPYAPHHFMLIGRSPEYATHPKDETRRTEKFYEDYSHKDQRVYLAILLGSLKEFKEELGPEYRVFSAGNWFDTFSNFDERNARTVGNVHDHINGIKAEYINDYIGDGLSSIEGYEQEKAFTNRHLPLALPKIQRLMPQNAPRLEARTEDPYGHSFVVPASADLDTFTRLMRQHHEAYTIVAQRLKKVYERYEEESLSQPSYNLYIELDEQGNRHVSLSWSVNGPIGALEAAGVQSKRRHDYNAHVDPEIAMRVKEKVANRVKESIAVSTENLVSVR